MSRCATLLPLHVPATGKFFLSTSAVWTARGVSSKPIGSCLVRPGRSTRGTFLFTGGPTMRAAIYARVSTGRQERDQTIEGQLTALRQWVQAAGHTLRVNAHLKLVLPHIR